ncbi:hypothetical protein [Arthrobacter sp. H41]|uniref:hypothetical protein n=1 Tax=Arthrobacter sp. H41 TaxID=1312978 RepID=UPI00047BF417|nr:hypothetical protein [Arthrobacter sp. H41]
MATSQPDQRLLTSFTSKEWNGRPGEGASTMFVGFIVLAYVLGLILMIFVSPLRSFWSLTLFAVVLAGFFTALCVTGEVSRQRRFLESVTATVNGIILELTGNPLDQLSVDKFRDLVRYGQHVPLLVNGVPGLDLTALRQAQPLQQQVVLGRDPVVKREQDAVTTTWVVLTITPPEYGISSFDRLLGAAQSG